MSIINTIVTLNVDVLENRSSAVTACVSLDDQPPYSSLQANVMVDKLCEVLDGRAFSFTH